MARKLEAARPAYQSEEFVQDSSDDETSTDKAQPVRNSKQINGSSEPSKSTSKLPSTGFDAQERTRSGGSRSESDIDGSSGSESGSDSSDSDSSSRNSTSPVQLPQKQSKNPKKRGPPVMIAPKTFYPPEGFQAFGLAASDYASQTHDMFDDLSTKQIWHISAPSSLPITSIKSLDIQAALRGDAIYSKDGISYNMDSLPVQDEMLFLPDSTEARYSQSKVTIARSFQLREMTQPANQKPTNTGSEKSATSFQFFASQPGEKKAPRQQPTGLKMRYVPYGVPTAISETEDDVLMNDKFVMPDDIEPPTHNETPKKKAKIQKSGQEVDDHVTTSISTNSALPTITEPISKPVQSPKSKSRSDKHLEPIESERKKKKKKSRLVDEVLL